MEGRRVGLTAAVEQRFGDARSTVRWMLRRSVLRDGAEITFRGMIDRVDLSPDGSTAVVIDYKTGGSWAATSAMRERPG